MSLQWLIVRFVPGLALALASLAASAGTVSLTPSGTLLPPNGAVVLDIIANFGSDVTIGGATDISWDSGVLTFDSFAFGSALGSPIRDSAFDVIDLQSPGLLSIGFGNFSGIALGTSTVIGTLAFHAIGAIGSSTTLTLVDSAVWSGFFDTNGAPISVSYNGASIGVVPLPGAAWLLLSGLAGLASLKAARRGALQLDPARA